uniref:Uncharacterized protein n=1 Tax=Cacopsylla melanoneura TaxID=428564 RepID=A0A8D8S9T1_9HEMI
MGFRPFFVFIYLLFYISHNLFLMGDAIVPVVRFYLKPAMISVSDFFWGTFSAMQYILHRALYILHSCKSCHLEREIQFTNKTKYRIQNKTKLTVMKLTVK